MRKNIMISPELDMLVKEAAGKYKTSESKVVEKALANFLAEETQAELPAFFDYAGVFDCRHKNLSTTYKALKSPRKR